MKTKMQLSLVLVLIFTIGYSGVDPALFEQPGYGSTNLLRDIFFPPERLYFY